MKTPRKSLRRSRSGAGDARDLRRAFGKELRRICRRASHTPRGGDVHAVRKGITRLRSWLRLAREHLGVRRFRAHNRRLRKAARSLAPVRDARVVLAAFEAFSSGSSFPNTSRHLRKQARRAKNAAKAAMRKVKRHLAKELEATNPLPAGKLGGDDLARALERMREAMAAAFAAAHASSSVELLHTWRKRTKNYLHALAFVEGKPSRRQRSAARISHILGEDHDLALLEAELAAGQDGLETQTLLSLIAARRANLRRQLFRR